jgi:hypothetical protein
MAEVLAHRVIQERVVRIIEYAIKRKVEETACDTDAV